ncbi:uncharacterized protein [Paramormyrops kingsleyae]|uniref:uncharacterized protein isoform X2 n=1 Tax=Paramormyrops kingsleyae TaxID=1676925 RepID=UPI003B972893
MELSSSWQHGDTEEWNSIAANDDDTELRELLCTPTVIFRDNREGTSPRQVSHKRKRADSFNDTAGDELLVAAGEKIEAELATESVQNQPTGQLEFERPGVSQSAPSDQGGSACGVPASSPRALPEPPLWSQDTSPLTPWQLPVVNSPAGADSREERLKALKLAFFLFQDQMCDFLADLSDQI